MGRRVSRLFACERRETPKKAAMPPRRKSKKSVSKALAKLRRKRSFCSKKLTAGSIAAASASAKRKGASQGRR